MKYSSTVRILNLVLFFILFAGFGALGIWAGILVTPFMLSQVGPIDLPDFSVALAWELGALGLAGAILSLFGLVDSIRAMMHANDDASVSKAISCYIGLGFLVALFLFLNGIWLYRLTTTNFDYSELGFAIAFFVVIAIIIAIAVSVPFVKMHGDDVNQNSQMSLISKLFFSVNAGVAIPGVLMLFCSMSVTNFKMFSTKLIVIALVPLLAAVLCLIAMIGYGRGEKTGVVNKTNGALFTGSLFVDGLGFLAAGCFSYFMGESSSRSFKRTSFVASNWLDADTNYLDFSIMSWIIGSLIILVLIGGLFVALRPAKNQNPQA